MSQNNTNEDKPSLSLKTVTKMLEDVNVIVANLRTELASSQMCYETATKVITDLGAECEKLKIALKESNDQSAFWKQEFTDASKQSLDSLLAMTSTKKSLDSVMESFFKYENK